MSNNHSDNILDTETLEMIVEVESLEDLVEVIINKRHEMSLSRRDLSERSGLSLSTITLIETYRVPLVNEHLKRISQVLNININLDN